MRCLTGPKVRAVAPLTFRELDDIPLERLRGIGERKAGSLSEIGLLSVLDLLMHYPRRYVDRTKQASIADLAVGDSGMVTGEVLSVSNRSLGRRRSMVEVAVTDGTGVLKVVFFNQPWRTRQLSAGQNIVLFGKMEDYRGRRQMSSPILDLLGNQTGRIVPVYPQSEKAKVTSADFALWSEEAVRRCKARGIADPLDPQYLERLELCGRFEAIEAVHNPEAMSDVARAHKRLVFDELLRLQLVLVDRKRTAALDTSGVSQRSASGGLVDRFRDALPFEMTSAQRTAIDEIARDMALDIPMHRLLQGDVGAGKTVVAAAAMLIAVESGHQAAMMAPTEVLAEQHYVGVARLVDGLTVAAPDSLMPTRPVRVALFTSKMPAAEKRERHAALVAGTIDIAVGTHALIQDAVTFQHLGLAIVDEQHRFGVDQRAALRMPNQDGSSPDLLVMTATPIPRSAAMTVYGDLDVSVLDELPPGRTPIRTVWAKDDAEIDAAYALVREEVANGHQAYVVCPLIEESEKLEAASVEETFSDLSGGQLFGLKLDLLHGRMSTAEKAKAMDDFRAGQTDVLVATTVIEVGVDVPNATVMVIIDADRFGIAQLHQLRGRVGRGSALSHCVLISQTDSDNGEARMQALCDSTDGFELAEIDLDLRGEGSIFGERQTGRSDLRLASLRRHRSVIISARQIALEIVDDRGGLAGHGEWADEIAVLFDDERTEYLSKG